MECASPICKNSGVSKCSACKITLYCSIACQRFHRQEHIDFCRSIASRRAGITSAEKIAESNDDFNSKSVLSQSIIGGSIRVEDDVIKQLRRDISSTGHGELINTNRDILIIKGFREKLEEHASILVLYEKSTSRQIISTSDSKFSSLSIIERLLLSYREHIAKRNNYKLFSVRIKNTNQQIPLIFDANKGIVSFPEFHYTNDNPQSISLTYEGEKFCIPTDRFNQTKADIPFQFENIVFI